VGNEFVLFIDKIHEVGEILNSVTLLAIVVVDKSYRYLLAQRGTHFCRMLSCW